MKSERNRQMHIISQNITTITSGTIIHQVNCMGVMGAGIALQIRNKWPNVFKEYRRLCLENNKDKALLGTIQTIQVTPGIWVCNLFGQHRYGRDKRYTEYDAIQTGLSKLSTDTDRQVYYIPFNMGCSNAGGDWDRVSKIIEDTIPTATICKFEGYR